MESKKSIKLLNYTLALADALMRLGYDKVYHMREVVAPGRDDRKSWIEAIEAKYEGKGQPYGRFEYERFLGDYTVCLFYYSSFSTHCKRCCNLLILKQAVTDIPAAMFPDELVSAYPSAKVVLTTRDEDSWYFSMHRTIWHAWHHDKTRSPDGSVENPMVSLSDKFHEGLWKSNFEKHGRQCFREHNRAVEKLMSTRPDDFLIYETRQGWEPLCHFLGKEVPDEPFPRSDHWAQYNRDGEKNRPK